MELCTFYKWTNVSTKYSIRAFLHYDSTLKCIFMFFLYLQGQINKSMNDDVYE